MPYNPAIHNRHSIRLPGYDYTELGAYFLTILTHQKELLFGKVIKGVVQLSPVGEIAQEQWQKIPNRFTNVLQDAFVIMPNHIHGILVIMDVFAINGKTFDRQISKNIFISNNYPQKLGSQPGSIPAVIQNFKSITSRMINKQRNTPGSTIWQRNYYEHIIRDEEDFNRIQEYILENPLKWDNLLEK